MSSHRNRVQVLLPDELYQSIATIARLSNLSMSGFVAQILTAEADTINQVANLMLEAREASDKLSISDKVKIDMSMMKATHEKGKLLQSVDEVHAVVSDANKRPSRTAGGGPARGRQAGTDPLAINKGAKTTSEGGKQPVMSRDWQNL